MRLAAIALVLVSASGVAQRTLTLPFSYENDFIVVEARLNDVAVTRLLFDTGSELTILTEPLLFSFLDPAGVEEITLVGSDRTTAIPAALVRRNRLDLGPVTLSNHAVVIVDDAALDLSDLAGEGIGGILGVGTFGAYVVEVNYRRSTIRLIPPRRFSPPRGAHGHPPGGLRGQAPHPRRHPHTRRLPRQYPLPARYGRRTRGLSVRQPRRQYALPPPSHRRRDRTRTRRRAPRFRRPQ